MSFVRTVENGEVEEEDEKERINGGIEGNEKARRWWKKWKQGGERAERAWHEGRKAKSILWNRSFLLDAHHPSVSCLRSACTGKQNAGYLARYQTHRCSLEKLAGKTEGNLIFAG